jgi:ribonuclease Z
MRFTFLGTSAGIPTRERNVTALAIAAAHPRDWYLVDCGEGTQHRLLHTRHTAARLRAIFITHVHGDHCYGLPGLIASSQMGGRKQPLTVCAPAGIQEMFEAVCRHTDMRLLYPVNFVRSDVPGFVYEDEDVRVDAITLSHRVPSFAYRFTERIREHHLDQQRLAELGVPRGPLWGDLQHGRSVMLPDGRVIAPEQVAQPAPPPRRIVVGGDNDRPELLEPMLEGCDALIHEATYTEDILAKVGPQYQHSTAAMVARTAAQARVPNLFLTHFSQRYRSTRVAGEHAIADLADEARAIYDGALHLARDLDSYEITRDRTLIAHTESRWHIDSR